MSEHTPQERAEILARMRLASSLFYARATQAGCHAFIEFTGLMNEFIQACADAEAAGDPSWVHANGHGENLPLAPHRVAYVREKLHCIYGSGIARGKS